MVWRESSWKMREKQRGWRGSREQRNESSIKEVEVVTHLVSSVPFYLGRDGDDKKTHFVCTFI